MSEILKIGIAAMFMSACSIGAPDRAPAFETVIFGAERTLAQLGNEPHTQFGYGHPPYFHPDQKQINAVFSALEAYRENEPALSDIDLSFFRFQVVGLRLGDNDGILLNAFCKNWRGVESDWTSRLVIVDDGGSCFFHVIYSLEDHKIIALNVNGEA